MDNDEDEECICNLSVKPDILIESQEIEFGIDGRYHCSEHGEENECRIEWNT